MSRYANKRMMFRSGGRFTTAPTMEDLGFDVSHGPRQCSCGEVWRPILVSGICPKCRAQDSKPYVAPAVAP